MIVIVVVVSVFVFIIINQRILRRDKPGRKECLDRVRGGVVRTINNNQTII